MSTTQQPTTAQIQPVEEASGTPRWVKVVMAAVFYVGLTIFLLGSIDHVAWFFHLYEPASTPGDWWALVPSYGKAGSLDLAIFFLAYVAATGQTADKVLTWTFTILLTSVSLYANYVYAMFFSPLHQHDIWSIQILFGVTTTGWLSPLIASSYPLFAIVFMYLIERVISRKAETPEQMRARLQALKEKKEIERQIKEVEGPGFIQRAKNNVLEVKSAASEVLRKEPKTTQGASENTPVFPQIPMEDKLQKTIDFLREDPYADDKKLADHLGLKRGASARFWRLKAEELLRNGGSFFAPNRMLDPAEKSMKSDEDLRQQSSQKLPTTDPSIEAVNNPKNEKEEQEQNQDTGGSLTSSLSQETESHARQKRYSPAEATRLPICQKKTIAVADIRAAIKSGNLEKKADGKLSKNAVEMWAKTYKKVEEKQAVRSA